MMFILKKLVSRFFFPLSLVIELLLLGIILKKRRTAVILAGVSILYLFSFAPFGYLILRPLESQYVPISSTSLNKEVRWIVVLGGGSREDKTLTPEDRLGDASLKRLLEGVRLSLLLPRSRLVLSGGDYRGISHRRRAGETSFPCAGSGDAGFASKSASVQDTEPSHGWSPSNREEVAG